jgi:hypothetical protein
MGSASVSKRDLLQLQRDFFDAISRPLRGMTEMLPHPAAKKYIRARKSHSEHARLQYYAQQYWWRLVDSFDEDFSTVRRVIGSDEYERIRTAYLVQRPSRSYTLRNLGESLPKFIRSTRLLPKAKKRWAIDAASYDWARIEAFDGASYLPITQRSLADRRFVSRKLRLQPYVRLLVLSTPVWSIGRPSMARAELVSSSGIRNKVGRRAVKEPAVKQILTDPDQEGRRYCAVHRFAGKVRIKQIAQDEFWLLTLFQDGCSLRALEQHLSARTRKDQVILKVFEMCMALGWLWTKGEQPPTDPTSRRKGRRDG